MDIYFYDYELRNEIKELRKREMKRAENAVWKFFCKDMKRYGFEEREGQQDMALDIIEVIRDQEHILVEAGVGLVNHLPHSSSLLCYYREFKEPIAIATSTIALQEQLERDIKRASMLLGITVPTVLAKGQTHFVCKQRLDDYKNRDREAWGGKLIQDIINNVKYDMADRRQFSFPIPLNIWNEINIQNYTYKKCSKCLHHNECMYYKMRQELIRFNGIVICNQDLLTVHLQKAANMQRGILNDEISIIVIDEAHNLEDKVRNVSTSFYSKQNMIKIVNEAFNLIRIWSISLESHIQRFNKNVEKLFNEFYNQIETQINEKPNEMKYAED